MNRQSTDSKPAAVRHPRKAQGLGHISYDLLQALPCANARQQRAWDDEMVPMLYSKIIVFLLHWTLAASFGVRKSWDQLMIQLQLDHNERVSSQVTKLRDHPPPTPHHLPRHLSEARTNQVSRRFQCHRLGLAFQTEEKQGRLVSTGLAMWAWSDMGILWS